jgi:hypothetical protein
MVDAPPRAPLHSYSHHVYGQLSAQMWVPPREWCLAKWKCLSQSYPLPRHSCNSRPFWNANPSFRKTYGINWDLDNLLSLPFILCSKLSACKLPPPTVCFPQTKENTTSRGGKEIKCEKAQDFQVYKYTILLSCLHNFVFLLHVKSSPFDRWRKIECFSYCYRASNCKAEILAHSNSLLKSRLFPLHHADLILKGEACQMWQ